MSDLADDVVNVGNEMLKLDATIRQLSARVQGIKDSAQISIDSAVITKGVANADMELLHRFLAKPYLILPKTETADKKRVSIDDCLNRATRESREKLGHGSQQALRGYLAALTSAGGKYTIEGQYVVRRL